MPKYATNICIILLNISDGPAIAYSTVLSKYFCQLGFLSRQAKGLESLPDSLHDPAVKSDRFRQDLKTHLFAIGH